MKRHLPRAPTKSWAPDVGVTSVCFSLWDRRTISIKPMHSLACYKTKSYTLDFVAQESVTWLELWNA